MIYLKAVSCLLFRCIPDKQRSFALGIQWIIIRTLGSIPGPVTFGAVIDQTCLFWLNPCGENNQDGACYFYSNSLLSYYLFAVAMACKVASVIFYGLAWLLYRAPAESKEKKDSFKRASSHVNSSYEKDVDDSENDPSKYGVNINGDLNSHGHENNYTMTTEL